MTTPGGSCSTVTHVIQVGPTVVTQVRKPKGAGKYVDKVPIPEGVFYEVAAVAQMFDVSRKRIYNLLSEHRKMLSDPMYRRRKRWLYPVDVKFLRQFFLARVKK